METAMTAPRITPSTSPPEAMLSRKFFSDGEIPGCAASAISGTTRAAAIAAAVNPAAALSPPAAALIWRRPPALAPPERVLLKVKQPSNGAAAPPILLPVTAAAAGTAIEIAEVDAICTRKLLDRLRLCGGLSCGEDEPQSLVAEGD